MKKMIITVMVLAVSVTIFTGCGGHSDTASTPSGMKETPTMSQAQLDVQTAKMRAFRASKGSSAQ